MELPRAARPPVQDPGGPVNAPADSVGLLPAGRTCTARTVGVRCGASPTRPYLRGDFCADHAPRHTIPDPDATARGLAARRDRLLAIRRSTKS
jgi:hypothetical protein